eukprot:g41645.t1
MLKLLDLCLTTHFTLNGQTYEQINGTSMGLLISGLIAEAVTQRLESTALLLIQPKLWIRYMDDTFVIIKWTKLEETHKLINNTLTGIKFTREEEKNKQLPFLDVMVERRTNGEFLTKETTNSIGTTPRTWDKRQAREFLEAWYSTKKAINKHIELDPIYTPLGRKTRTKFHPNFNKFIDNTTIVGRILNNDEPEYRKEIEHLVAWCKVNTLSVNVSKTKQLVIDFRKQGGGHAPIYINGAEVEMVKNVKFLGVTITNNLSWSTHIETMVKKTQQHLFFLKRPRKILQFKCTYFRNT